MVCFSDFSSIRNTIILSYIYLDSLLSVIWISGETSLLYKSVVPILSSLAAQPGAGEGDMWVASIELHPNPNPNPGALNPYTEVVFMSLDMDKKNSCLLFRSNPPLFPTPITQSHFKSLFGDFRTLPEHILKSCSWKICLNCRPWALKLCSCLH